MIYNTVDSREIIARIENDFNIDYAGWIGRAPQWIADCLGDIEIFAELQPVQHCYQVVDYKLKLPCNLDVLEAVKYNGERLDRVSVINHKNTCDLAEVDSYINNIFSSHSYEIDNNGWLIFDFEEGEVTLYYRAYPFKYDQVTKIYFPLVPDNQKLKMAIELYVIKMILSRGHKHPVFDLDSKNEATNPFYLYKTARSEARNSVGRLDKDGRAQISNVLRDMLVNTSWRFNEIFDNSGAFPITPTTP